MLETMPYESPVIDIVVLDAGGIVALYTDDVMFESKEVGEGGSDEYD